MQPACRFDGLTLNKLPPGKIKQELLDRLLRSLPIRDPRLIVAPGVGEDAAVIDFGAKCLVAKTDPITFVAARIGWYAVHINANDIAVMGARPSWFLATLLLPEEQTDEALVESIFQDIASTCAGLGITLCGGHTEITPGLERPIVVGLMLGEVEKGKVISKRGLRPGLQVLLTKGVAIEGTAIIARELEGKLAQVLGSEAVERAKAYLYRPGISVLREAEIALSAGPPAAMHDPTEGGLAGGLCEMARAGRVGLYVYRDKIKVLPETAAVCGALGLNPLALIASGALLIAAEPQVAARIGRALWAAGIEAEVIAETRAESEGLKMESAGEISELSMPERDEITRALI